MRRPVVLGLEIHLALIAAVLRRISRPGVGYLASDLLDRVVMQHLLFKIFHVLEEVWIAQLTASGVGPSHRLIDAVDVETFQGWVAHVVLLDNLDDVQRDRTAAGGRRGEELVTSVARRDRFACDDFVVLHVIEGHDAFFSG